MVTASFREMRAERSTLPTRGQANPQRWVRPQAALEDSSEGPQVWRLRSEQEAEGRSAALDRSDSPWSTQITAFNRVALSSRFAAHIRITRASHDPEIQSAA